jgi:hypothetical protein
MSLTSPLIDQAGFKLISTVDKCLIADWLMLVLSAQPRINLDFVFNSLAATHEQASLLSRIEHNPSP